MDKLALAALLLERNQRKQGCAGSFRIGSYERSAVGDAFLYRSRGEDSASGGLRLGFAMFLAIVLAIVLLLYRFITMP